MTVAGGLSLHRLELGTVPAGKLGSRLNAKLAELFHVSISACSAVIVQSVEESAKITVPLLCASVLFYRPKQPLLPKHRKCQPKTRPED
ncbi:hypothetical protein ACFPVS_13230 [Neisseria weixii]|uniref:Uncharacterized protein n=2 Tax=Neisseria weixii TaxID=1853276 RepID=A0A3N4MVP3_9NEIS|nr:hypothetical protein [Neisseria weixii]ATD65571.1 hypothetical protein CGZ65_10370 [Neisseria weixii]RPD83259.1 hypothetical protein EGK74_12955 [Neisseria weixii]RPD83564.1 hypothetical protein EGK75_13015 [Neisseria weixii]